MAQEQIKQSLMPRIPMYWFFVAITVVAILVGIVQLADQGQVFATAFVAVLIFVVTALTLSAIFFIIAFLVGDLDKGFEAMTIESPFADRLPDQVIPPRPTDSV